MPGSNRAMRNIFENERLKPTEIDPNLLGIMDETRKQLWVYAREIYPDDNGLAAQYVQDALISYVREIKAEYRQAVAQQKNASERRQMEIQDEMEQRIMMLLRGDNERREQARQQNEKDQADDKELHREAEHSDQPGKKQRRLHDHRIGPGNLPSGGGVMGVYS